MVDVNYQARIGMLAAGAYGLPQFRMRVFLWGARPSQRLPQHPLPTHDVIFRGVIPTEFNMNAVAHTEGHTYKLENKLFLGDAIEDLPPLDRLSETPIMFSLNLRPVNNDECRDEIPYAGEPMTNFQRYIRLTKDAMLGSGTKLQTTLYDHRPLQLNIDDYQRVCRVPKRKGANFRDLPGVRVRPDKKVPDYAMTFVSGTSCKLTNFVVLVRGSCCSFADLSSEL